MTRGHLTLIRCDEITEPAAEPLKYEPKSVGCYTETHRLSVWPFASTVGPKTPHRVTARITTCSDNGPTASAELNRKGITELRDLLTTMLENYGWDE